MVGPAAPLERGEHDTSRPTTRRRGIATDWNNLVFHEHGSITGEFGSSERFVFTGANGGVLCCRYGRTAAGVTTPGMFELVPVGLPGIGEYYVAYFIAEFVPVDNECTGKFAGGSGSWIMYAETEPFELGSEDSLNYSWEGQASLTVKTPVK